MERDERLQAVRALLDWALYAFWTPVLAVLARVLERIDDHWDDWAEVVEDPPSAR
jgi:hypothetical protein